MDDRGAGQGDRLVVQRRGCALHGRVQCDPDGEWDVVLPTGASQVTRPEKIEAKVAEAVWTSRFSTPAWEKLSEEAREECRTIARDALAALSVEDLLSLAFTEEERATLVVLLAMQEPPATPGVHETLQAIGAKLRGSDDR